MSTWHVLVSAVLLESYVTYRVFQKARRISRVHFKAKGISTKSAERILEHICKKKQRICHCVMLNKLEILCN